MTLFGQVAEIHLSDAVCPRCLREAGLVDVRCRVTVDLPRPGECRRTHLLSLIASIREKVIASGAMDEAELERHQAALTGHLADPNTLVIDKLLMQCWGHKPNPRARPRPRK